MKYLQSFYIVVLNFFYEYFGSKISEKNRNRLIFISCLLLSAYFPLYYSGLVKTVFHTGTSRHLLGSVLIAMLIVVSINKPLKHVEWNKVFTTVYFLCGAGIFIAGCIHPIGDAYRPFSLIMLFGFPCLYFVWNNRADYHILYDYMSKAVVCVGIISFLVCLGLSFRGNVFIPGYTRYQGFAENPNLIGMLGTSLFVISLYLLMRENVSKIIYMISAGAGLALILFTQTRTAMLTIIACSIVFIIFFFRHVYERKDKVLYFKTCVLAVIVICITIMTGYRIMDIGMKFYESGNVAEAVIQLEVVEAAEAVESTEMQITDVDNVTKKNLNGFMDRFSLEEKTLDAFSSGRITLWKKYIAELNWLGNDYSEIDFKEFTNGTVHNSHNNILEFAFRCGIPTGILYMLMQILAFIYMGKGLISRRKLEISSLYVLLVIMMFSVYSMIDIQTIPFARDICFLFFFSLAPVFAGEYAYKE